MSTEEKTNLPPLSAWLVESLRVTVFPEPDNQFSDQKWWHDVVGEMPEQKTNQPRLGVTIEEGKYNQNSKLVLAVHPTRIDWGYNPIEEPDDAPNQLPNVGGVVEAFSTFTGLIKKWFSFGYTPTLKRLAFGGNLLLPVKDVKEGYDLLSQYLSLKIDTENSSDFLYQINRRRNTRTGIPKLRINRLTRWSVMNLTITQLLPMPIKLPPRFACRLELDVNTDPLFEDILEISKYEILLDEFVNLSKEIMEYGNIP